MFEIVTGQVCRAICILHSDCYCLTCIIYINYVIVQRCKPQLYIRLQCHLQLHLTGHLQIDDHRPVFHICNRYLCRQVNVVRGGPITQHAISQHANVNEGKSQGIFQQLFCPYENIDMLGLLYKNVTISHSDIVQQISCR